MKKFLIAVLSLIICLLPVCVSACELNRKVNGAEVSFPKTVSQATAFSFDMVLTTESGQTVYVSCVKDDNDYAYNYRSAEKTYPTYRQIYTNSKLYSILEAFETIDFGGESIPLGVGTYYVENKPVNVPDNLLYSVTENILKASYVTLVTKAIKEISSEGVTLYRYDITYNDVDYSVWFDELVLRRVKIVYSDNTFYDASFSSFKFGTIDKTYLITPENSTVAYIQSPFSQEEWCEILTSFGRKIDGALPKSSN